MKTDCTINDYLNEINYLRELLEIDKIEIQQLKNELEIADEAIGIALNNPTFPNDNMFELEECKIGYCKGLAKNINGDTNL